MSNIKLPRKEFESALGVKINNEIEEKISLFGTPLEHLDDDEIEIEIFPNRPDLLSLQGYIRSFKAFLGKETGLKKYQVNKPEKEYTVKVEPSVKSVRPFTACAIVKNLKFDDEKIKEVIDLQEKLHSTIGRNRKKVAIGIYPLEKIKLPITYLAKEPKQIKFIPLESDKEMTGEQILRRHPKGRDYAHLLEDKDKFPIFIDSNSKILSLPPIINSDETGKIIEETKEVFIECSGFDFETLSKTLNIISTALADMGGKIYAMNLMYLNKKILTPDLSNQKIKLSLERVNKLIGLNIKEKEISNLLAKMGHDYKNKVVFTPAWRTDILHEVDLIEDIAIAYGFNNLIPEIPNISTIGEEAKSEKIKSKISEILIGLGLIEISSYHLIKQKEGEFSGLKDLIEVEDSKTDYKILRPNLLVPALRILTENKDHEYPQEIFEIGTVFEKDISYETGIKESQHLLVLSSPSNFTKIKQLLNCLTKLLNIKYEIEEFASNDFINGRTGKIMMNNKNIGIIGELHPETLRKWGIKMPCAALEIDLAEI